ncbi:MAG TPA: twin-arginine translocase TatA/TatE family subunit [Arenibacter sp.]|nr:twin-arginine translocase TatA/TatE family subunit [Arenibacter sp.]
MLSTIVLFISGAEIFFIMFIVVMVFGADKIPDIAKGLGKGMRQLKDATEDIKQEIQKSADKQGIDTSIVDDIRGEIDNVKSKVRDNIDNVSGKVKENVDDVTGVIKRK